MRRLLLVRFLASCTSAPTGGPRVDVAGASPKTAHDAGALRAPPAAPATRPCAGDTFGLADGGAEANLARIAEKRGTMGRAKKQMVASSHALATEAGLSVLRAGGNAADAFVATVLAHDVLLPGVTSTAGLAGILVYEAKTRTVTYVHGGLGDPVEPTRRHRPTDTAHGKLVLVPGAPAAYAELAKRFGRKPLTALVEPAAKLATAGFPVTAHYARSVAGSRAVLERSDYGKKTFFRDGKPVAEGDTLKLEELGRSLRAFGKNGRFFHEGRWAAEAVALANRHGGTLVEADFASYAAEVAPALHGSFMGHELYAAGHGGLKAVASLGALEMLREGRPARAPAESVDDLERLLRVQHAATKLAALKDRDLVVRGAATDTRAAATTIAAAVRSGARPAEPAHGTHSSAAIVVDADGNVVVGTHTIETLNWGEGLFVGGVPLSTAAPIAFDDATRAERRMRIDPLSSTLALKDGVPRAALTVYGSGLHPADVQILDAVLARGLDAEDAVLEPRVGYFYLDIVKMEMDKTRSSVDPRFSADLLCAARARGVELVRSMPGYPLGTVDTGFPTLVTFSADGLHGMTPDAAAIHGVAAGD